MELKLGIRTFLKNGLKAHLILLWIESKINREASTDLKLSTFRHLTVHFKRILVKLQIYQP